MDGVQNGSRGVHSMHEQLRSLLHSGVYALRLYGVNRTLRLESLRVLWPSLMPDVLLNGTQCGAERAHRARNANPTLFIDGRFLNGNAIWVQPPITSTRKPAIAVSHQ